MDGILPLFKERGMTSNDAVIKCRKIFKTRKIGHSGTLDPEVDGVLPICVGKATKVVNYLMESGKIYRGEITLGFSTTTEDLEGEVIEKVELKRPFSDEKIEKVLNSFIGDTIQIPPIYSAVKVNGRRLYEYARAGEKVDIPKRTIHVDYFKQIGLSKFNIQTGQQKIEFEVACGKGTYVRTLAVDVGKKLDVPAVMSRLTRIKSGGFDISETYSLLELEQLKKHDELSKVLKPIQNAVKNLPVYTLNEEQWKIVKNGGFLSSDYFDKNDIKVSLFYQNKFRCIYCYNSEKDRYQAEKMIDLD